MTPEMKRAKNAYRLMHRRCLEPKFKDFGRYGGSTPPIKICPQWLKNWAQFIRDMGAPPTQDCWLGRKDVKGHYTPDNCIWTSQDAQANRRSYCRVVVVGGKKMTAAEAGRLLTLPTRNAVLKRWNAGFSLETPKLAKVYKRSMWLTHQGETLPLPEWARRVGLPHAVVWARIKRGMPVDVALTPGRFRKPSLPKNQLNTTKEASL